jgi:hypothetical protein
MLIGTVLSDKLSIVIAFSCFDRIGQSANSKKKALRESLGMIDEPLITKLLVVFSCLKATLTRKLHFLHSYGISLILPAI